MVPGGSSAFPKLSKHGTVLLDRHWIDVFSSFFISMIILIVLLPFSSVNIYLNLYIKHFNGPVHVMFSNVVQVQEMLPMNRLAAWGPACLVHRMLTEELLLHLLVEAFLQYLELRLIPLLLGGSFGCLNFFEYVSLVSPSII
jgi:hypothetical protein